MAIIISAGLLSGCTQRKGEDKVTLRFVSWGNESEERSLRTLIDQFEKTHPKIKIELQITPHVRVFDKLMISTAGGRPPDVTRVSSMWFHPCAARGLFADLGPFVKRDKSFDLSDFYPQAIDGWGKHNGRLYALPTDIDIYAMYYNKDMFDKAGISYPDWSWDWSKYLEVSKKLTKDLNGDGRLDQWGTATDQFWQSYVFQNGGQLVSSDQKHCMLSQPAAYEAIQWESDLINKYHVSPNAEENAQIGPDKLFMMGKIGMYISGSWAAELVFKDNLKGFTYDVAPFPKGKERVTFIGGGAYAIMSRSEHKDEAWEFLKWMTGPEYQRERAVDSQIIPSRRSVAESGAYLKLAKPPAHRKVFLDLILYGKPEPSVSVMPEMREILNAEISLALLGKESAKDACKKVTPVVDQLLRHQDE
ncbi:MAG: sugar ABC transporter substrate-binding protein [Armatimonadota bacterium]